MKDSIIKAMSLFSGCMGLDIGLNQTGIQTLVACEIDKACQQTIRTNLPNLPLFRDVLDITCDDLRNAAGLRPGERPHLVVGGPPCQAFSTAGRRQAFNDPRGNVFLRYLKLIDELQPEYAVIENVRGLLSASLNHTPHAERSDEQLRNSSAPGTALDHILNVLRVMGYGISFNLYNAANFGVPQIRERVIIIASRNGEILPWLTPTHSDDPSWKLPMWCTFRDAVRGLREEEMDGFSFPEKRLRFYKMLSEGQYWKDLPQELWREALGKSLDSGGGKTGFYRRLAWDKPSPTLVTHPAMPATDLCHPEKHRPLSVQEYKRIQQFPDEWIIEGRLADKYRQIGNAVPVGLGAAIGRAILAHMNGEKPAVNTEHFRFSRYKATSHKEWRTKYFPIQKTNAPKSATQLKFF